MTSPLHPVTHAVHPPTPPLHPVTSFYTPATSCYIPIAPVRERVSARTEREEAVPVEGTCALDRAPTQKNFTKNNFSIHHGSGRGSLSLLAAVLIFRPLPQRPLSTWRDFPAPSVGAVMREVGPVWFVYSTTLLEPAKGETDDLGYVTKRLALIF